MENIFYKNWKRQSGHAMSLNRHSVLRWTTHHKFYRLLSHLTCQKWVQLRTELTAMPLSKQRWRLTCCIPKSLCLEVIRLSELFMVHCRIDDKSRLRVSFSKYLCWCICICCLGDHTFWLIFRFPSVSCFSLAAFWTTLLKPHH